MLGVPSGQRDGTGPPPCSGSSKAKSKQQDSFRHLNPGEQSSSWLQDLFSQIGESMSDRPEI